MLELLYHIGHEDYIVFTCPSCSDSDTYMNSARCNWCYEPIPNVESLRRSVVDRLNYHITQQTSPD